MTKANTNPTKPPLHPITPEHCLPFKTITIDFIIKLPPSDGYDLILTITNHDCTKASIFIPCNKSIDAPGLAKLYANYVFPHYGIPRKIISDREPQLILKFTKELCSLLKTKQNLLTAYYPQTDGQSEQTNQLLEQFLQLYCRMQQSSWARWLPMAQYVRNLWPHSTTKKTLFDLLMGYTPRAHHPTRAAIQPDIETCIKRINQAREEVRQAITNTQAHLIKGTKFKPFSIDDKVWLEGTHISKPYTTKKFSPKQYGPFEITAVISLVVYQLQLPTMWQIHPVFHAVLLMPYNKLKTHGPNFLEPPPEEIEGEPKWEIEQILRDQTYRGKKQYLVCWEGYSPAEDSWVLATDLQAPKLLAQYQSSPKKNPLQPSKPQKNATHSIRTLHFKQDNDITQLMTLSPINYASPIIIVSELPDFSDSGNPPFCPGTPYPWVFNLGSSQEGPPGPSNHLFHPDIIQDTWELAQAATTWFNQDPNNFPPALHQYINLIIHWLNRPCPISWTELLADHHYPYLHGALQAYINELTPYCLEQSYSPLSLSSKKMSPPIRDSLKGAIG